MVEGDPVPLGGPKPRSVLALLLLAEGEAVATDRLVDELWRERPPPTAVTALQGYVSALRKALGPGVVVTRAPGYAAAVPGEEVDLRRFEAALRSGRDALARSEYATAARVLRDGLARGAVARSRISRASPSRQTPSAISTNCTSRPGRPALRPSSRLAGIAR